MSIVSVRDLRKTYNKGKTTALSGIDFEVEEGEIFGLIGPDGAGKTSIFRILATLINADSGTVFVDGLNVATDFRQIRKRIGYMPGRFSLYQDLTVEENLAFFATIFNTTIQENYRLIEDIYKQIEPFATRRAGKLSGGMKQKLALSCALIHAPRVLFLDEPTTGVDPVSRHEFWEMLQKLKRRFNLTIIVATPYMDEAMQCDRIALIQNGQFLSIDTPRGLIEKYSEVLWALKGDNMHKLLTEVRVIPGVKTAFAFGEALHLTIDSETLTIESFRSLLERRGHSGFSIEPVQPSIEDCFMNLQQA